MALTIPAPDIRVVTSGDDDGPGTLRDALKNLNINPNVYIRIDISVSNINLTGTELAVPGVGFDPSFIYNIVIVSDCKYTITRLGRIFFFDSSVKNFIVNNANLVGQPNASPTSYGGGVVFNSNGILRFENSCLSGFNGANFGGAIYSLGRVILVCTNIFCNSTNQQGGGIWSTNSVTLYRSSVSKNWVTSSEEISCAGGIYVDQGNVVVNKSKVSENWVNPLTGGSGGAIVVMNGNITIENCSKVDKNYAFNSGGIQQGVGDVHVFDSQINKNYSTNTINPGGGGAITIIAGTVNIINSDINCNISNAMEAPGVVSIFGDVIVSKSNFSNNRGNGPAGAIACNFDGSIIADDSVFCNNTGASLGGVLVNFAPTAAKSISLNNCCFSGNILTNAQTIKQTILVFFSLFDSLLKRIVLQGLLNGDKPGALVFAARVPELVEKAYFVSNLLNQLNIPNLNENLIAGGVAGTLLHCQIISTNCVFKNNYAGKSVSEVNEPFLAVGGVFFALNGSITISAKSLLRKNKAKTSGGAVWSNNVVQISDSSIKKNEAEELNGGGLLLFVDAKTLLISTKIENNKAGGTGDDIHNLGELIVVP